MLVDVKLAWRMLTRRPMLSTAVVFVIGLAIAVSSALFSVLDGLLFRPLPFDRPSELVAIDFRQVDGAAPPLAYEPALQDRRIELRDAVMSGLSFSAHARRAWVYFPGDVAEEWGLEVTSVDSRFFDWHQGGSVSFGMSFAGRWRRFARKPFCSA
jgi:hypothetical protein